MPTMLAVEPHKLTRTNYEDRSRVTREEVYTLLESAVAPGMLHPAARTLAVNAERNTKARADRR